MSSEDNPSAYSTSSNGSPWSSNTSWQSTPAHRGVSMSQETQFWLSDLDAFALATTPSGVLFDSPDNTSTPSLTYDTLMYDRFHVPKLVSTPQYSQAFPQTGFILYPQSQQTHVSDYTPSPQPHISLDASLTIPEPPASRAANQLLYPHNPDNSPVYHEAAAAQPTKRMKITRNKPLPHKRDRPRHNCKLPECGRTFGRSADLVRHQRDVHAMADKYYECEAFACLYRTRRNDKMKEHCQTVHEHPKGAESFATVLVEKDGRGEAGKAAR